MAERNGEQSAQRGVLPALRLVVGIFGLFVGPLLISAYGQPQAPGTQVPNQGADGKQKDAAPNEAGRKQLRDAIQKLFQPEPAEKPEGENAPQGPGRLEDQRAPVDQQTWDQLERIQKELKENRQKDALADLQKLFERGEDSGYLAGKEDWISAREEGFRLFESLAPEIRQQYETQYGGLAQQRLLQASESGSSVELAEVATRYFFTAAGQDAANRLASRHIDHQEYAVARIWLQRLSRANAEISRSPVWKLKALRVAVLTGDEEWRGKLMAELEKLPADQLKVGDQRVDLATWGRRGPPNVETDVARDWGVFYGSAPRNSVQPAGTPWLRPHWRAPFAGSELVQRVTQDLWKELQDRRIPTLPAAQPLAVGDRLIVRNWQGVQVFQGTTGKLLWEARDRISPEEILLALYRSWLSQVHTESNEDEHHDPLGWASLSLGQQIWQGGSAEFSPVAHFLFRDYNYGLQSSDGNRLFVIHEQPVLMAGHPRQGNGGEEPAETDPFGRHWFSNLLVAYDLANGRRLWELGGGAEETEFVSPLAGWFFLGAPTPVDGELVCVGEKKGEIRLMGLDPAKGELRWSQLLGYAETRIGEDLGRQWLSVQPTVAEGLIVCPLMTGWIVAVDRLTHSLVWTVRTRPAQKNEPGSSGLMPMGLGERWALSPLVTAGDRLLCAPPEGGQLLCLSLSSGKVLWSKPRESGLYIAGVHGASAIVVGRNEVKGYKLANGETWRCDLPDRGYITGRGIITAEGILQLPVSGGELVCVSLREHKIQTRLRQIGTADGAEVLPVGNLVRCGETWCSVHPLGIQAFESQGLLEAESKQKPSPLTADWLQKQAAWLSMRGEYRNAWNLLALGGVDGGSTVKKNWNG
ncbi:MAG: PQQ-binding-like beta-propeller repeat protein [Planctomycetales bacterium]